ncbi:MAG: hypothetical protein HKM98_03320 [Gammaproteobacteria bacterium]|nr:hypothetical protein [Gammaproteobacteria bacterium]
MKNEQVLPAPAVDDIQGPDQHPRPGAGGVVRSGVDRRKFTWRTVVYSITKPRRKRVNRSDDKTNHHVDFHPRSTSVLCAGIVALAAIDAFFTLYFYDMGMTQFNGLVLGLLSLGRGVFVAAKILVACFCVLLLSTVSSINVFGVPARYFLWIVFVGYGLFVLNMVRFF